jgi:hypothetical protein
MSFEVVYSTDRLERLFTEIITEAKTILDAPKPTSNIEEWKKSMAQFYSDILFYITTGSFLFKHPAYSNEQEYRFLHGIPSAFAVTPHKYRLRPHSLISYKELDWKPNGASALRRIVVGPAGDQAKAERFAKDCLRRTGLNEIEIVHSEIPYRLT